MVKKSKILITLLLLSFTTSSQIDTSKICLPYNVVKNISIELVQKDSLENELHETQTLITVYKSKVSLQDSTIQILEQKETNYLTQIDNLTKQDSIHTEEVTKLRGENSTLSRKNKNLKTTTKILGGGFLGALAFIIILL